MPLTVIAAPPRHVLERRRRKNQVFRTKSRLAAQNTFHGVDADEEGDNEPPRKKQKRTRKTNKLTADDLDWNSVEAKGATMDGEGVMYMLEEIEGVNVVYGEPGSGATFSITRKTKAGERKPNASRLPPSLLMYPEDDQMDDVDAQNLLPQWGDLQLKGSIKRALHALGFEAPTEIQKLAIPKALEGRDVIGVAETGSGKTLAYGLPMINHILSKPPHTDPSTPRPLTALILAPTRELALQVCDHLNKIARHLLPQQSESTSKKGPPRVSVGAIIGGLDAHKQTRVIKRGMDIMVATPGRLWDMITQNEAVAAAVRSIRFLVLDEADRMIETGHFAELEKITKLTFRVAEGDKEEGFNFFGVNVNDPHHPPNADLQTMIFSATLSKDLQQNLKKRAKASAKGRPVETLSTLDELLMKLDFRDPDPELIDLSPEGGVVSTLQESKVECLVKDKDVYLYYFLLRYPGRSLVFLGSIDGIRRLVPILQNLNLNILPLHSQMEQKQRLRNLDRFRTTPNAILIATDIAARGLDIPSVDHVIHYQIPRSADVYVHRSGRTARAKTSGFSLLLIGPEERKIYRLLMNSLGRPPNDIPDLILEMDIVDQLKQRVSLARRLDTAHHKMTKTNHERNWIKNAAKEAEVDLDSDFDRDSDTEIRKSKKDKNAITALKAELNQLLKKPLLARGVSTKFITSGNHPLIEDLMSGSGHAEILGVRGTTAGEATVRRKA